MWREWKDFCQLRHQSVRYAHLARQPQADQRRRKRVASNRLMMSPAIHVCSSPPGGVPQPDFLVAGGTSTLNEALVTSTPPAENTSVYRPTRSTRKLGKPAIPDSAVWRVASAPLPVGRAKCDANRRSCKILIGGTCQRLPSHVKPRRIPEGINVSTQHGQADDPGAPCLNNRAR